MPQVSLLSTEWEDSPFAASFLTLNGDFIVHLCPVSAHDPPPSDAPPELSRATRDDGFRALAEAIVLQAVADWRTAGPALHTRRPAAARALRSECEAFFTSDWYRLLTGGEGCRFLDALKRAEP